MLFLCAVLLSNIFIEYFLAIFFADDTLGDDIDDTSGDAIDETSGDDSDDIAGAVRGKFYPRLQKKFNFQSLWSR